MSIKFYDEEHKQFYEDKLKELERYERKSVYEKALVYTLGLCEDTRSHFDEIYSIRDGEINLDSLQYAFQTHTSLKVTRMAFSLFNDCVYDSVKAAYENQYSKNYTPGDIFCCSYAPYFYEAVKLRYPEYTKEKTSQERWY